MFVLFEIFSIFIFERMLINDSTFVYNVSGWKKNYIIA